MKPYLRNFLLAAFAIALALPAMAKPNFIVIFIDDMGYGDIGPFGSKLNRTPQLDRMASEGMKLTSFYAAPVCSASRAQLLTGCYAPRVSVPGVFFPAGPRGLHPDEQTGALYVRIAPYEPGQAHRPALFHRGDAMADIGRRPAQRNRALEPFRATRRQNLGYRIGKAAARPAHSGSNGPGHCRRLGGRLGDGFQHGCASSYSQTR